MEECYNACCSVARKWLNILLTKGEGMPDEDLVELISESKNLSKDLSEYDLIKGVGITAAKRMGELFGEDMIKGKGINTKFIIANKPIGS